MTPLRLLVLALLFYCAWRLLRKSFRPQPPVADAGNRPDTEKPAQDVLVEDPICHVLIPKHQALRVRRDGVTYYFCSEQCCDQFTATLNKGEQ